MKDKISSNGAAAVGRGEAEHATTAIRKSGMEPVAKR